MKFCAVQGCYSNDTYDDDKNRRFYMFPQEVERARRWLRFTCDLKRKLLDRKRLFICDRHFVPSDFDSEGKLNKAALPTRNGPTPDMLQLPREAKAKRQRRSKSPRKPSGKSLKTTQDMLKNRKKLRSLVNPPNPHLASIKTKTTFPPKTSAKPLVKRAVLRSSFVKSPGSHDSGAVELIQLNPAEPSTSTAVLGDHSYSTERKADNVLVLTPVAKPPDFIRKKVQALMKSQLIVSTTTQTKPPTNDHKNAIDSHAKSTSEIKTINLDEGHDNTDMILDKMVSMDAEPGKEKSDCAASRTETPCEMEENVVLDKKPEEPNTETDRILIKVKNNTDTNSLQRKHVGQATITREQIDSFLDSECVAELNENTDVMSEASEESVVYLVIGDNDIESDCDFAVPCDSDGSTYPIQMSSEKNTKGSKTTASTELIKSAKSTYSIVPNDSKASSTRPVKRSRTSGGTFILKDTKKSGESTSDVVIVDLEGSRSQSEEIDDSLKVKRSVLLPYKVNSIRRPTRLHEYSKEKYEDKTPSLILAERDSLEKLSRNRVEVSQNTAKRKQSASNLKQEQLPKSIFDATLPSMPLSSTNDRVEHETTQIDRDSTEHPSTNENEDSQTTRILQQHLNRVKELRKKKIIKKYSKPKTIKKRKLPRSKYSIAAFAESLGTFNCHPPERAEPVDLHSKAEWHKLYTPSDLSRSFPKLNDTYIGKIVNQLRENLTTMEPRDRMEVSFLLSLMSAYPGAPEYVKELMMQRLNLVYIASVFKWETAIALATKGMSETGPSHDQTVRSIPTTKGIRHTVGRKRPRSNPKYYSQRWKSEQITLPVQAVVPPTFAFEVIVQEKEPNKNK